MTLRELIKTVKRAEANATEADLDCEMKLWVSGASHQAKM